MATILQGVAAFGHFAPPVVVYAKQPVQARGRAMVCFPSEYTTYVFCVNCGGRKWDIVKRFRDFMQFEAKLVTTRSARTDIAAVMVGAGVLRGDAPPPPAPLGSDGCLLTLMVACGADGIVPRGASGGAGANSREELLPV